MALQFWKDREKELIDPTLFSETADKLAREFKNQGNKTTNNPTQLRKFYDEVVRFQGMLQGTPEQFDSLLPYIKMLNAKVAYAVGRGLVSEGFRTFLSDSLAQIKTRKDFEVFCSLFEAVLGFYKFYSEEKKQSGGPHTQHSQGGGGHHRDNGFRR